MSDLEINLDFEIDYTCSPTSNLEAKLTFNIDTPIDYNTGVEVEYLKTTIDITEEI